MSRAQEGRGEPAVPYYQPTYDYPAALTADTNRRSSQSVSSAPRSPSSSVKTQWACTRRLFIAVLVVTLLVCAGIVLAVLGGLGKLSSSSSNNNNLPSQHTRQQHEHSRPIASQLSPVAAPCVLCASGGVFSSLSLSPNIPSPAFRFPFSAYPWADTQSTNVAAPIGAACASLGALSSVGSLSSVGALQMSPACNVSLPSPPLQYASYSQTLLFSVSSVAPAVQSLFGNGGGNPASASYYNSIMLSTNRALCQLPDPPGVSPQALFLGFVQPGVVYRAGCVLDHTEGRLSGFLQAFDAASGATTDLRVIQPVPVPVVPPSNATTPRSQMQLGPVSGGLLADAMLWTTAVDVNLLAAEYSDERVTTLSSTASPTPATTGPATDFDTARSSSALFGMPGVSCQGSVYGATVPPTPLQQAEQVDATTTAAATITLNGPTAQYVDESYIGLSFEMNQRSIFSPYACQLQGLLALVGPGVVRLGGGSLNQMGGWVEPGNPSRSNTSYLSPFDWHSLAGFLQPTGWKVIIGLPIINDANVSNIVACAVSASSILGPSLYALQLANEPDEYFNSSAYSAVTALYGAAIKAALPSVLLASADAADNIHDGTDLEVYFNNAVTAANLNITDLMTVHYYNQGKSSTLNPWSLFLLTAYPVARPLAASVATYGLPARLTESGTFSSAGQQNVSNSFASAYWLLQFAAQCAAYNISGVHLHGGLQGGWYSPLVNTGYSADVTTLNAQFYAMLLWKVAAYGGGQLCNANVTGAGTPVGFLTVCVATSSSYNVLLLNVQNAQSVNVTLSTPQPAVLPVLVTYLTAPDMGSVAGQTVGGQSLNNLMQANKNGSQPQWAPQSYVLPAGSYTVYVPPLTIALAQVQYADTSSDTNAAE